MDKKKLKKKKLSYYIGYIPLSLYALICLFPFFWMVSSSFKEVADVMAYPPTLLPSEPIIDNYIKAWTAVDFSTNMLNSALITCVATLSVVITSAMAAYSMVVLKVRGSSLVLSLVLLGLIVPVQTSFVPMFMFFSKVKLIDTYTGVILPYMSSAFGVFMLHQFFKALPLELADAARIDGLGEFNILLRILMPIAKPGLVTLVIFTFMNVWTDFFWPFLLINSADKRTVPVGIVAFWRADVPHYGIILAAAVISMIPLITVFALFQKQFVQGIAFGGIKQ